MSPTGTSLALYYCCYLLVLVLTLLLLLELLLVLLELVLVLLELVLVSLVLLVVLLPLPNYHVHHNSTRKDHTTNKDGSGGGSGE